METELKRLPGEEYSAFIIRWKSLMLPLLEFYNSDSMVKKRYDHGLALKRERSRAFHQVLSMASKKPHVKSDGSLAFSIGNCVMGSGRGGVYSAFQKFLVEKLTQLGYFISYEDEYLTSQKFPIFGYHTTASGQDLTRIKYCAELNIHIHRDLMAGEQMADIFVARLKGLGRPLFLCPSRQ
jgi:hypothetical protein